MTLSPNIAGTPFVKMHGTRNYFVIVDARKGADEMSGTNPGAAAIEDAMAIVY